MTFDLTYETSCDPSGPHGNIKRDSFHCVHTECAFSAHDTIVSCVPTLPQVILELRN